MKMRKKIWVGLSVWFLMAGCVFMAQAMAQQARNVYVADFLIDKQPVAQEDASRQGPLERFKPGIIRQIEEDRSVKQEDNTVQLLSQFLVEELNNRGIPAIRVSRVDELAPDGVLVQGEFLELDVGDPLKRAAVGFNSGAAKMEVKVMVSKLPLSENKPEDVFDLQSSSGKKGPGGLLGVAICGSPYALAAKFVVEKHAAQADVRKLASEISGEIQEYLQKEKL